MYLQKYNFLKIMDHTSIFIVIIILLFSNYFLVQCNQSDYITRLPSIQKHFINTHSSISTLALNEEPIYKILKNYSKCTTNENLQMIRYLVDYKDSTKKIQKLEGERYENITANHPLLSFRLIYRYVVDLKIILKDLDSSVNDTLEMQSILRNVEESTGWPDMSNIESVMSGILRIHHVYDVNVKEFSRGNIFGYDTKFGLKAKHCYYIGQYAIKEKYFAHAVEWLEAAKMLIEYENDKTLDLDLADQWLAAAITIHDLEFNVRPAYDSFLFKHKIQDLHPTFDRIKRRTDSSRHWKGRREIHFNVINFWTLCSGEDLRTEKEKSQLYCWYERNSNPAWFINPLKIEQLAKTPWLIQIYEVLTNNLINKLIHEAKPELRASGLYNTAGPKFTNERTSQQSWLNDSKSMELRTIPRRIELITKLLVLPSSSSEILQVATYSFGGHYAVHQDALKNIAGTWGESIGDRIATFMIYLSDVEKGGFTAFPQAGIAARPVKGSAVFWYNLLKNGIPDEYSYHGACPVILGSKWVANKWIRSNDQFLSRPCSLNSEE